MLSVKSGCFSGKNLKHFITDCKIGHQSKIVISSFNFVFFSLLNEAFNIKIFHPEIEESAFTTPSNRPHLSRRDYLNYDQKVSKVSGDNPDALEFGRI